MLAFILAMVAASLVALPAYLLLFRPETEAGMSEALANLQYNGDYLFIAELVTLLMVAGVMLLALGLRSGYPPRQYLAANRFTGKHLWTWLLILVGFIVATDSLLYLVGKDPVSEWQRRLYESAGCLPCMFFAIIILAPVIEETVFRGFVFTGIQARLGAFWAVVFASLPWAILHVQYEWYYMPIGLGLGVLFSLARWRSGSVLLCISLHTAANLIASMETVYSAL